jgi:serine/threonine-protein kinase RsbW
MTLADSVRLNLPASHKYLHLLGSCIRGVLKRADGLRDPEGVAYNVELAVHEIGANIVDHAYEGTADGRIDVTLTLGEAGSSLIVDLRDTGRAFDPNAVPEPALGEAQIHGYGLFLVRELMDTVEYTPAPAGNHWRLTKNF